MRGNKSGGEIVSGNKEDTGWKSACERAEGTISKRRRRLREGCSLRGMEGCSLRDGGVLPARDGEVLPAWDGEVLLAWDGGVFPTWDGGVLLVWDGLVYSFPNLLFSDVSFCS